LDALAFTLPTAYVAFVVAGTLAGVSGLEGAS
jgi:hypothetical protein